MTKFLNLLLPGAVTGAIYSIMATGLVLTYTTSGIFNLAHGAIAFTVAYFYYQLNSGLGVPIVPAALISVCLFAPALGLLLDRLILRRLSDAPEYARVVGTIGLLVALPNLAQWLVVAVGNNWLHLGLLGSSAVAQGASVPGIGPTPPIVYHPLSRVALTSDQLIVLIAGAAAAASMWYLLRHTRAGLEMRAVVDRRALAGLRGVDEVRASATAWVCSMLLAGLGGVLIAPLFQLDSETFTLVVLSSLAAVVLGGLRSLPIALVGGIALGIVQNLIAGYSTDLPRLIGQLTGLRSAVPYALVLILGLVVGRDRARRAGSVADNRRPPDHRAGVSKLRRRAPWAIFLFLLVGYSMGWSPVSWMSADSYHQTVIAQGLAMAIIFLSFVVVTGMGGMVSLAQATFATAGGFAAGWSIDRNWGVSLPFIAHHGQLNFFWAVIIAALVSGAMGAIIAIPATRLGPVYLAIWSLAGAFFFSLVVFSYQAIGKGQVGWTIRAPSLSIAGTGWLHRLLTKSGGGFVFSNMSDQILLLFSVFGVMTLVLTIVSRSRMGRAILAVRSSEAAAEACGIVPNRTKVMAFTLSAAIAGVGGVMLSLYSFTASTSSAPPQDGLLWLALVVLFGVRRPGGALLAGLTLAVSPALLQGLASLLPGGTAHQLLTSPYFVPILSGIGAIQLAMEPDGILAYAGHQRLEKSRAKADRRLARQQSEGVLKGTQTPQQTPHAVCASEEPVVLSMDGISAGYGDVKVLRDVSLELRAGEVMALLGSNGAGKSTLAAVASGALRPHSGSLKFAGRDITGSAGHERFRSGLLVIPEARGIFPGLTVEENLRVALKDKHAVVRAFARFPILNDRRNQRAGMLSGGEQQMLSLAPSLSMPPAVLIADEPTLGLAPLVATQVMSAILELRDQGVAILLIEENAQNALRVAESLAFMELGRIKWCRPREEADAALLGAAYLGEGRVEDRS